MLPSSMLLGVMFGLIILLHRRHKPASLSVRWLRLGVGIVALPFLAVLGWKATVTLRLIWPVIYDDESVALLQPQLALDHLEKASTYWSGYRLMAEKGTWARAIAIDPQNSNEEKVKWNELAADAYKRAYEAHPFNPELAVNLGNICAELGRSDEAERCLVEAVELQGGLEAGFRARYYLARHLYKVWQERWIKERRAEEALGQFLRAKELLDTADPLIPVVLRNESSGLKKGIAESIEFLEGAEVRPVPAIK